MSKFKKSLFVVFFAFLIGFFNIYGQDINPLNNNGAPKIEEVEDKGKITQQNPLELKDILNKVTLNSQDKKEIEIKKDEVLKLDFNLLIDASQQEQLKNQAEQIKLTLPAFLSVDKITSENKGLEVNKDKNELTLDFKKLEIDEKVNKFAFTLDTKIIAEENKKDYTFEINNDKYAVKLKEEVKTEDSKESNSNKKPSLAKTPTKANKADVAFDMNSNGEYKGNFLDKINYTPLDSSGKPITDPDYNPTVDTSFNMNVTFGLTGGQVQDLLDDMNATNANIAQYSYQLPPEFKNSINNDGKIMDGSEEVGEYSVDTNGKVIITLYKSYLEDKNISGVTGSVDYSVQVNEDGSGIPGTITPKVPGEDNIDTDNIKIYPRGGDGVNKTGSFDSLMNPTKTEWNVLVNKGLKTRTEAFSKDKVPDGLLGDPDNANIRVCKASIDFDGNFIDCIGDDLVEGTEPGQYQKVWDKDKSTWTIKFNGDENKEIEDPYSILYEFPIDPAIIPATNKPKSSTDFINSATFDDKVNEPLDTEATITGSWGPQTDKLSAAYDSKKQVFTWTINYNQNGQKVP